MAVPRWTTAQPGTNFFPVCSMTLCCPFDRRREHVLDVDVGDGLAGRDGRRLPRIVPTDVGSLRRCGGAAPPRARRATPRARRGGGGALDAARAAALAPRGRGGRRLDAADAAEVLQRPRQQRGPLAIELGGLGDRGAQRLDLRLQLRGPRAAAPRRPTTPPPRRRAATAIRTASESGDQGLRCCRCSSRGSSVSSSCVDDQNQKHERAERDRAPDQEQQRCGRARTGGGAGTSQASRAAVAPSPVRAIAHQVAAAAGGHRLGPVDQSGRPRAAPRRARAPSALLAATRSPMKTAPVTPSAVPTVASWLAPQRQPLDQQRRRLVARADRRDARRPGPDRAASRRPRSVDRSRS